MTKRSIVSCIILSLFTCGLYTFFWIYGMYSDINRETNHNNDAGMDILLMIVTCGIWTIWCIYKYSKRIAEKYGEDNSLICLILMIFGCGLISYAILQNQINNIADNHVKTEY